MKSIKQLLEMKVKHGGGGGSGDLEPPEPPDDGGEHFEPHFPDLYKHFVHHHKVWDNTVDKDVSLSPYEEYHAPEIQEDMEKYHDNVDYTADKQLHLPYHAISSNPHMLDIVNYHFDKAGHPPFHDNGKLMGGVGAVFTDHHFDDIDDGKLKADDVHTMVGHVSGHHGNREYAVDLAKEMHHAEPIGQHPMIDTVMHWTVPNRPGGDVPSLLRTPAHLNEGRSMLRHGTQVTYIGRRYMGHNGEHLEHLDAIQHPHKVAYKQRMWAHRGNEADDSDTYLGDMEE